MGAGMPSEKQIEAAQKVFLDARPYMGSRELATLMLTAAEQAEPATDVEPYTYFYRYSDPMSGKPVWRSSGSLWNGQRPSEALPLYTRPPESQLRELITDLLPHLNPADPETLPLIRRAMEALR